MGKHHLGEFEEIVLLTVAILDGKAYGNSIIEEIEKRLDRKVSIGAIQTVLKRLEKKDLLDSQFGEATATRGGRRRRYYHLTSYGISILEETKKQRISLWNAAPKLGFNNPI